MRVTISSCFLRISALRLAADSSCSSISSCFLRISALRLVAASCSSISSCFYIASNSRRSIRFAFDDFELTVVLLLFEVALTDPLLLCSGNTFKTLIDLITSHGLAAPTTRRSSSVTLFDCVSDLFSLVTSTEQLRFVGLKLLCLSFLVWGHLIASFVETPIVTWRCFVLFVSSFGPFNIVFTSGDQYPQLASNFTKNSSHSVTLRLSCLCFSSSVDPTWDLRYATMLVCFSDIGIPNHSIFLCKEKRLACQACHPTLQSESVVFQLGWPQCPHKSATRTSRNHFPNLLIWGPSVLGSALCFFDQIHLSFEDVAPRAFLSFWLSFVQFAVCRLTDGFLTTQ